MTDDLYHRRLMENPFHILGATPALGARDIPAREEASRLAQGPELAAWAAEQLLHPHTRLLAEIGWVYDVPDDLIGGLLIGIEERSLFEIEEKCSGFGALDQITIAMDLIASRRPDIGLDPLPWLVRGWAELDRNAALRKINDLHGLAQEPPIGPEEFDRALEDLRSSQVDFVTRAAAGLISAGSALQPALVAFTSNESFAAAPAGPPTEVDADPEPMDGGMSWLDAVVEVDSGKEAEPEEVFGLFDEDLPTEELFGADNTPTAHPEQASYQDPAVFDAIMGIKDAGSGDGEEPEEIEKEQKRSRPRRRAAFFAGAGVVVASLIGLVLLPGGEDAPQRLDHTDGQPMLVLGQPQSSDAVRKPEPQALAKLVEAPKPVPAPAPVRPSPVQAPVVEALPDDPLQVEIPATDVMAAPTVSVAPLLVPDLLEESTEIVLPDLDVDMVILDDLVVPELPLAAATPDLPPVAQAAPGRPAPRLRLARPPHGNDDRMSIEELRYCHVEFMTLERMPDLVLSEAAQRGMLFRALEHVSRCEGGSFLAREMEQVRRELEHYDFAAEAERFAGKW